MGFFDKINYRMIVNAFKQVCNRTHCAIFFVNVPQVAIRYIPLICVSLSVEVRIIDRLAGHHHTIMWVRRQWPVWSLLTSIESSRDIFLLFDNANSGVNRMKFITLATASYILPFVQTELRDARYEFTCWKLHICNGQRKSWFCCSVSPLIATNIDMPGYPA